MLKYRRRAATCRTFGVLTGVCLGSASWAQPAPVPTPAPVVPGSGVPTREQIEPVSRDPAQLPPMIVQINNRRAERGPCPFDGSDLTVAIRSISYATSAGAPLPPELLPHLQGIRPVPGERSVTQICDLRDAAYAALFDAGYIASVLIPPQEINAGELRLTVVTARLVQINVRGDKTPYDKTLRPRLAQLRALDPLNTIEAERILLLAGDIPGLDVQLDLRPAGAGPGELIGELTLRYRRGTVFANANNFGSRALGRSSVYLRGEAYGLTGAADATFGAVSFTPGSNEQRLFQVGHSMGLGPRGTSLQASFTYASARPDLGALDLRTKSMIGRVEASHPLYRSLGKNLILGAGAEVIEQRTKFFFGDEGAPLFRDKLRIAFVRATGILQGIFPEGPQSYSLLGSVELRRGLDIFDATTPGFITPSGFSPSRFEGSPAAMVVRGEINAVKQFRSGIALRGTANAQWANKPLLSVEEFAAGNLTIGRGYDPGASAGDRALAFRGEIEGRLFRTPPGQINAVAFYDHVRLWNLDSTTERGAQRLRSFGGGLRVIFPGYGIVDALYAHPTDPALPGAKRAPDRVLVSFTASL